MKKFRFLLLASPFLLAACGEGYEMIKTDTMFPYGNQRTAGSGVAYVLAKMMPPKEVKVERPMAPPAMSKPADKIFEEKQLK